ncbi:uncharacterized protein LY79DRAFT_696480 [Colletotrichum navitas]|uniref:Uncharacterized protein n=1 Tax=Colletotrichum navitas TaxID=681940 RepID=A0AAD8UYQ4_9PEZI|nr:uncharacterized protein LY79DRAFT_696480 [Colletotrichum navitas]KAK1574076.1 hypothetical protein LY79DRAFT_696480 [Colletotrichum navitas]
MGSMGHMGSMGSMGSMGRPLPLFCLESPDFESLESEEFLTLRNFLNPGLLIGLTHWPPTKSHWHSTATQSPLENQWVGLARKWSEHESLGIKTWGERAGKWSKPATMETSRIQVFYYVVFPTVWHAYPGTSHPPRPDQTLLSVLLAPFYLPPLTQSHAPALSSILIRLSDDDQSFSETPYALPNIRQTVAPDGTLICTALSSGPETPSSCGSFGAATPMPTAT